MGQKLQSLLTPIRLYIYLATTTCLLLPTLSLSESEINTGTLSITSKIIEQRTLSIDSSTPINLTSVNSQSIPIKAYTNGVDTGYRIKISGTSYQDSTSYQGSTRYLALIGPKKDTKQVVKSAPTMHVQSTSINIITEGGPPRPPTNYQMPIELEYLPCGSADEEGARGFDNNSSMVTGYHVTYDTGTASVISNTFRNVNASKHQCDKNPGRLTITKKFKSGRLPAGTYTTSIQLELQPPA